MAALRSRRSRPLSATRASSACRCRVREGGAGCRARGGLCRAPSMVHALICTPRGARPNTGRAGQAKRSVGGWRGSPADPQPRRPLQNAYSFDAVDLDPYGSPSKLLDSAVQVGWADRGAAPALPLCFRCPATASAGRRQTFCWQGRVDRQGREHRAADRWLCAEAVACACCLCRCPFQAAMRLACVEPYAPASA